MNNSQVAHVWAQQKKPEAEGSSFYFKGTTIYSFGGHFPIARFTDETHEGERVVLFTIQNGWGGYTGRHIGHARNALQGLPVVIIECLHPAVRNGSHGSAVLSQEEQHEANATDYQLRYSDALNRASRATKHADSYLAQAEELRLTCAKYCEIFRLETPAWINATLPANLMERAAKAKANAEQVLIRKLADKVSFWRNGNDVNLYKHPETMLRLTHDGRNVETSRGAVVPLRSARLLWAVVERAAQSKEKYNPSGPGGHGFFQVGEFSLRYIDAEGNAKVGCHFIKYDESRAFAIAQGWAK